MLKTRSRILIGMSSLLMVTLFACGEMAETDPVQQTPDAGVNEPVDPDPDAGVNEPPPPPEPEPARFAEWTDEERERAILFGGGDGAVLALIHLIIADIDAEQGTCPERVFADDAITYRAGNGCVSASGATWAGEATGVNAPRFDGEGFVNDPSLPTRAEFRQLRRTDEHGSFMFDGTYVKTPTAGGHTEELDLTVGSNLAVSMAGTITCVYAEDHRKCTINEGAHGEVAGKGTFLVRGEFQYFSDGTAGWMELHGQDLMRVDVALGQLCAPITIDGVAAGELCGEAAPEEK